ELTVTGNDRVRTENNCVPRDIVALGKHLLFGFNVFMGLKQERAVSEVFSLHDANDFSLVPETEAGGFLADRRFVKDFEDLCKYYKDTKLLQLRRTESRLLAIFQTGHNERDIKVFRFSVDAAGKATYIDNRGENDLHKAPSHDFEWQTAGRERQVSGRHPHVNILDEVFVETVGGDLTVKIENNTEDGLGIYREPVSEKDQSLDDAEFHFAKVGAVILLKVKPFREDAYRYLVFNTRTQTVKRADAIGVSCVQLPEEQGVIFPGGYALQTGEVKLFDAVSKGLEFERALKSPNGEDVLYVFHEREAGTYVLLPYNLVRKEVQSPIPCEGYSLFADGRMVTFRFTGGEAQRVHPMQVWQTPFLSPEFAAAQKPSGTFLSKIGNPELVRGISEVLTLERMAETETPTRRTWEDLVAACTRATDAFFWLGNAEVNLLEPVKELASNAELIIDEFEKVLALQRRASEEMTRATVAQGELLGRLTVEDLRSTDAFMDALTALRTQRGRLISLKEVRYVDLTRIEGLEKQVIEGFENVSKQCVGFLLEPTALQPVVEQIGRTGAEVQKAIGTAHLEPLQRELERIGAGLDVLGEIVGGLQVGDPVARAKILEGISEVFSHLNRVRAQATGKKKELLGTEKRAEFGAQFKLLGQSIESALGSADSPEKCDELLARLQVQLEELEGRFSELDEFAAELAKKREELFEAFEARKQTLVDERQRRAQNLFGAADRILQGVARRAKTFKTDDELNSYFAADPMVQKLGDLSKQLLELKDSVKADELDSRLKTARQDALRALRDKKDLFEDGANVIKLGAHRFNVNVQPLELTVLPKEGGLFTHLTGSDYLARIEDPALEGARDLWDQSLPSETADVYRGEYLAWQLAGCEKGRELEAARAWAASHLDEGYERGIHDADAALIAARLTELKASAGLLRYPARARALATLFWAEWGDAHARDVAHRRAMSLGRLQAAWKGTTEAQALIDELAAEMKAGPDSRLAAEYLAHELAEAHPRFVVSGDAVALRDQLRAWLETQGSRADFEADFRALSSHPHVAFNLAAAWLGAFAGARAPHLTRAVPEAAALLTVDEARVDRHVSSAATTATVDGLLGQHPRLKAGKLELDLPDFMGRLSAFVQEKLPRYRAYREQLSALLQRERKRLRLDELQPKVLSSFVRNQLIDQVYLPLIGTNLAKQLGTAGENKRTDRMGLLLLVSPPGYGKTTLMEYVASRLGLTFVKVNGPALGHDVTSVDPADAPNATARQEVERINFAFELGNNVMLYLDDIQHTNPELLQKFISLCDAQRRIEGVWGGQTRTYDFRGKKFCVVMAGNPYTESGERFRIPDMLANRADTYNLGEILDGKADLFALSYLENALTSNTVLAPLATRPAGDVHKLIKMAQGGDVPSSELEHGYSAVELQEIGAVMQRMFKVQATLLKVNQQYIASASQDDRFRTEPPFKLQGSYRNMNKLAEKVASAMTDSELETLVDQHYAAESQTLTSAAEVNLLKLAELRGRQSPEQAKRWEELKRGYQRVQTMGGKEDDPAVRVSGAIASIGTEVQRMGEAVIRAASQPKAPAEPLGAKLDALAAAVRAGAAQPPAPPPLPAKPYDDRALLQKLDALAAALRERPEPAPVVVPAPAAAQTPDLSPILDKLTDAVRAMSTSQAAPASPPGLAPKGTAAVQKHVALLRERLAPLAQEAKAALAQGSSGQLQAVAVWQTVSEALEVLAAMSGTKPTRR
ncbi:MAG: DNA repair ATPase, partial [Myxococcaceae bacterium]|nr:DNA repair ATPase [Myxococcaceae bacterium]